MKGRLSSRAAGSQGACRGEGRKKKKKKVDGTPRAALLASPRAHPASCPGPQETRCKQAAEWRRECKGYSHSTSRLPRLPSGSASLSVNHTASNHIGMSCIAYDPNCSTHFAQITPSSPPFFGRLLGCQGRPHAPPTKRHSMAECQTILAVFSLSHTPSAHARRSFPLHSKTPARAPTGRSPQPTLTSP